MPRTPAEKREKGSFKATLHSALNNVQEELRLFASDSRKSLGAIIISTNYTLGETRPADPGVAVWFEWDGMPLCIPIDRYATIEANLQAIFHVLGARRVELRHGTLQLVRASFAGFLSLPAPEMRWWEVLDINRDSTRAEIDAAFKRKAADAHPDRGGDPETMALLNLARGAAHQERS
jgi:hypothetical protein